MTDIRDQLNAKRATLLQTQGRDMRSLAGDAAPGSEAYNRSSRNISELRSIEATLATLQLADAQREVAAAQRDIAQAQREANDQAEDEKARRDDRSFWGRRYVTTLAVANAGGLFAVIAFLVRSDAPAVSPQAIGHVMILFGIGAILGGGYPVWRLIILRISGRAATFARAWANYIVPAAMTLCFGLALDAVTDQAFKAYGNNLAAKYETARAQP